MNQSKTCFNPLSKDRLGDHPNSLSFELLQTNSSMSLSLIKFKSDSIGMEIPAIVSNLLHISFIEKLFP